MKTAILINFEFNLGKVSDLASVATKVYIDDIRLIKQGGVVTSDVSGDTAYIASNGYKPYFEVNGKVSYVVSDPDANLSSTAKDTVTAHISSDSDKTGFDVTLTETDNDTGLFASNPVTIVGTQSSAAENEIYAQKGDVVSAAYTDSYAKNQTADITVVDQQSAKPTADTVDGQVASAAVIHLSSATEGAAIYYSVNKGAYTQYDDTKGIIITAATEIDAIAVMGNMADSDVATFNYIVGHDLLNGTFDSNTDNWSIWDKPDESNAIMAADSGKLKVSIPNPGYEGWENWGTQVYQDNLKLEGGQAYTLSFVASATASRNIWVDIEDTGNAVIRYLSVQTIAVTGADNVSSFDFTLPADASTSTAKLIFMLGNGEIQDTNFTGQSIYIDNIKLNKAGHDLLNGTFDSNTDNWSIWDKPDESSAIMAADNGKLKVSIPDPGYEGWENWGTQVYQDNLKLEGGKTYTLSFVASATASRNIWVDIEAASDNSVKYLPLQTIAVTGADNVSSFDFTLPADASTSTAKLIFMFGNGEIQDTNFTGQSIYIDNIAITENAN